MSTTSLAARRALLVSRRDLVDAGGGGAFHVHTGDQPATPEDAPPFSPLAIVALDSPAYTLHATDASMTLTAVGNAAQAGTPTFVRQVDGNGVAISDYSVGLPGSGAEIEMTDGGSPPSLQMFVGGEITLTHTITRGA